MKLNLLLFIPQGLPLVASYLLLLTSYIGCKKTEAVKQTFGNDNFGDYYVESSIGDASYLNPILASDSASFW